MKSVIPELKSSEELLIRPKTGELWVVDRYALKERGYPQGGWELYENVTKEELLKNLRIANGISDEK